ncbi:MAG TPA: baseplate J/gp47 family protein [Anaerolineales bacterium]
MKIQIIQLEPEDDHASARDKLSQVKAPSALLVWPRRGRPLARRLDLELIARHARRRGITLGLVAFDPEICALAARVGIPVFNSLEGSPTAENPPRSAVAKPPDRSDRPPIAELRDAREAARKPPYQLSPRARQIGFGVSILSVLVLVGVLLPRASVTVRPDRRPFHGTVGLWIDPNLQSGSTADRIPGHKLTVSVSGESRIETSGRARLPSVAAAGEVSFRNLTDDPVDIPTGTGVRAGSIRFVTASQATLDGDRGAEVSVPIMAALPGRSGNVAAGTIDAVEGELGFALSVSNPEPTRGGQDVLAGAVSAGDFTTLRSGLEFELLEQAASDLRAQLSPEDEFLPGSERVIRVEVERYDRIAGAAAETLGLELTLEVEGLSFGRAEAEAAVEQQLPRLVPELWQLVPGSLSVRIVPQEVQQSEGAAIFGSFQVRADTARQVPFDQIRRLARGAPSGRVADDLRLEFELAQAPVIRNSPAWLPWLPFLELQIEVAWPWEAP